MTGFARPDIRIVQATGWLFPTMLCATLSREFPIMPRTRDAAVGELFALAV